MHVHVREKRASRGPRPPTVTGNSPIFSSPSLLPRFFPSLTAQRMSCSCVSGPPRMKSPFSVMIFLIEVGARHIYDDTGFCHNYCHRSVICMTEFFFVRPKMSQMCLFFVVSLKCSWTTQRMSCSCASGPPRTKSPFSVMTFCHRSRNPPHL